MNLNKIVLVILLGASSAFGQDIGTTEVKVVEGFKPVIPGASRLNENATFADTIRKDRTQIYEVVDVYLNSDYKTRPLAAAKVKDDKIAELYATKIGLGFGNAFMTNASILHNSRRSRSLSFGLFANHFANKYYLAKNSKNNMCAYVKKIESSYVFLANQKSERNTVSYYNGEINLEEDKFFRNRFAYTKFSFSATSREESSQKLKHQTTFSISDLNELSENQVYLGSNLRKEINGLPYSLEISFDNYLRYNNSDSKVKNTDLKILTFSPNVSFNRFGIDFDIGFDFDLADDLPLGFFPGFKATKELVKNVLLVYGGLNHDEQIHTLKSLSDENPYIHSFGTNQSNLGDSSVLQELEITDIQELYIGIRNVLGKGEMFEGSIAYGIVSNFSHFIHSNYENYHRFKVVYIDVKQLHLNANYYRRINDIISLQADANYFSWDVDVYYKPSFAAKLASPINLRDKIKVSPSVSYMSERSVMSDNIYELPTQIHINLGVYYSYSNQLSAYLQLNNLTNSEEDLWLGYREIGFNGLFGVDFFF